MTNKQIANGNKIIAEFMNKDLWFLNSKIFKKNAPIIDKKLLRLSYHRNWQALMPVVCKVQRVYTEIIKAYYDGGKYKKVSDKFFKNGLIMERMMDFEQLHPADSISKVYSICVDFIKWYNKNK